MDFVLLQHAEPIQTPLRDPRETLHRLLNNFEIIAVEPMTYKCHYLIALAKVTIAIVIRIATVGVFW